MIRFRTLALNAAFIEFLSRTQRMMALESLVSHLTHIAIAAGVIFMIFKVAETL